ncbi:hypothetical protein L596_011337 [Steinernema carpocapsae]|uniref:Uncharacterized protein n=1 Tax=Steinernema carpocapsae TaxID=34508 RepID=A0A4U5NUI4_STECR|nr:hypothetical protein L596_011337 [Steinernema carpocapsae]
MPLLRDDCESVQSRTRGCTCICAKIVNIGSSAVLIEDDAGKCELQSLPSESAAEVGDHCYFYVECGVSPLQCRRLTVVPPEMLPVARFQLEQFRRGAFAS